jgi:murein DD-endopeptidase MepM/ murein hydrolase activator NlpD
MAPDTLSSADFLDQTLARWSLRATRVAQRFPRSLTAAVVVAMAGFGATAFGVAPLDIDTVTRPQAWITESVAPDDLGAQIQSLATFDLPLFRNAITRASDTADSLLQRLNVNDAQAAAFIRSNPTARELLAGRGGKMVQARTNGSGELEELVARYPARRAEQAGTHFTRLLISREGKRFATRVEVAPLEARVELRSGIVSDSLFGATDDAGIPDSVAVQLAEVFSTEINFHRDLRRGDSFTVSYEALTADGEPVTWNQSARRLLAAEFVNRGRSHSAIWFQSSDKPGRGAYFDFNGRGKQRAFLASPMEFSRVTSGFAMRFHPILQNWRQHRGVDYGAPSGTSVRTVADGVVDFAGWKNGYGNVVSIRHGKERSTVYAHLSRIDVRKGQSVEQGSRIGAVGATGWATGPHLHFEFKVGGMQKDPSSIAALADAVALTPLSGRELARTTQLVRLQLDVAESSSGSAPSFE